jgi:L-aspartate oxidase
VDVFADPIPVAPAAHYWMGGVTTDLHSRTGIPGLYAIGETASTGIHGANRLASNSLLECIVFGQTMAALELQPLNGDAIAANTESQPLKIDLRSSLFSDLDWISDVRELLPVLMWRCAGISRNPSDLETAIAQVEEWRSQFHSLPVSQALITLEPGRSLEFTASVPMRNWGELHNLLDISVLILRSALFRTESRGGHYRADYPESNPDWLVHTVIQGTQIAQSAQRSPPSGQE